jgi:UDP-N-acetyl-D-glucosamine dehydrogenase
MSLIDQLESKSATIGIVGLGYIGLPLVLAYVEAGCRVLGFDTDNKKIERLSSGQSYIKHISDEDVATAQGSGQLEATTDFSRVSEVNALILCVPTPLDEHLEPDLSYVRSTLDSVCPHLQTNTVVSLESTTYPGTTAEEMVPRLEKQGLIPGETTFVVYSPEREDPGNTKYNTTSIPKIVGGHTAECLEVGKALYNIVIDDVVPVSSTATAEMTKLLENIFRAVNIGLVNEMKVVAEAMGIDIWEVIEAASTKPFGFTPFYPGPGLGGHCIPIDPFYLTWKAKEYGLHTRFIETAGQINRAMPMYVVNRTVEALNEREKPVKGSRILFMGLAYKADVDDMRESPTFELMNRFTELGAHVEYYDPHVPVIGPTRDHSEWEGKISVEWTEKTIASFDAIVISTNHKAFNLSELASWSGLIVDTRNALGGFQAPCDIVKA